MITSELLLVILVLLLGLAVVMILVYHKIRRVHLATFDLANDLAVTRRESESVFSQLQALWGLERLLGLSNPLPPLRGWAGSPDFLLRLAQELMDRKPVTVLECSSGASTIVCARMLQRNGGGHVFSLEHDPVYALQTRRDLAKRGLQDWATVVDAPLVRDQTATPWYSLSALPANLPKIDIVVVDGPPESTGPMARYPALPQLAGRLAKNAAVFVDDANRPDEKKMLLLWRKEFSTFVHHDVFCEKGLVIVERIAEK